MRSPLYITSHAFQTGLLEFEEDRLPVAGIKAKILYFRTEDFAGLDRVLGGFLWIIGHWLGVFCF